LPTDATLVEAPRRGDVRAFEALVVRTHRAVYGLVWRLVGNHEDAADVMQETYLRIWRGLGRYRGDAAFETWAYRVAANAALSHLRRRAREPEPIDPGLLPPLASAAEPDGGLEAAAIERALLRLPAPMRTVIVLKDIYGFSLEEIARRLGATEGAVKVRLFRARRRLAEELYGDGVVVPIRGRRRA
jgi:RNA polymerase sigma-70 factor (ECF subfamily)